MRIRIFALILILAIGIVSCQPAPQLTLTPSLSPAQPTVPVASTATATVAPTATRVQPVAPTPTSTPIVVPTVAPATQPTPTPTAVLLRVQVNSSDVGYLNVRDTPSTSGALIVRANDGVLLDVLDAADTARGRVGQQGQWLKIRTPDGQEGFAAAWYLRLPGVDPAPTPIAVVLASPTPVPNPSLDAVIDLLNRTNALRAENRLPPYRLSSKLNASAERHSQDMANTGNIDHTGSDGSKASQRIADTDYDAHLTGENIYAGRVTIDTAWAFWRDDPTHRANLLSTQFAEIGVSVVRARQGWYYFTMDLAQPAR